MGLSPKENTDSDKCKVSTKIGKLKSHLAFHLTTWHTTAYRQQQKPQKAWCFEKTTQHTFERQMDERRNEKESLKIPSNE